MYVHITLVKKQYTSSSSIFENSFVLCPWEVTQVTLPVEISQVISEPSLTLMTGLISSEVSCNQRGLSIRSAQI